jgi:hypothetical protein
MDGKYSEAVLPHSPVAARAAAIAFSRDTFATPDGPLYNGIRKIANATRMDAAADLEF